MLPAAVTVVGKEEHTGLIVDLRGESCHVQGRGSVVVSRKEHEGRYDAGQSSAISTLGAFHMPELTAGVPTDVVQRVLAAEAEAEAGALPEPDTAVLALVEQREAARSSRDWGAADQYREQIGRLG